MVLQATGRAEQDAAWLEAAFTALRQQEWAEFIADCGKFDAEIDKELALQKLTMAELEEEEQSLDRLRRWHRELAARDVFGAPLAAEAQLRLKHCGERLAEFTDAGFPGPAPVLTLRPDPASRIRKATSMNPNTSLFLSVNDFARATPWLHGPLALYAGYGLVVFAGLLLAGWWIARRDGDPARMAAALWAPLGTLLAVALNQPIWPWSTRPGPTTPLTGILVLATPTTDPGFPSDHAMMAGAVTAGLFLVQPHLGWVAALAARADGVLPGVHRRALPAGCRRRAAARRSGQPGRVGPAAPGPAPGGRRGAAHPVSAAAGGSAQRILVVTVTARTDTAAGRRTGRRPAGAVPAVRGRVRHRVRRAQHRRRASACYAGQQHTSLLTLGMLLAVYDGAEVMLKPVFGTLADRIGPRPVLLGGLLAFAAASAGFVVVGNPALLGVVRFGSGRGRGGVLPRRRGHGRPAVPRQPARPGVRRLRGVQEPRLRPRPDRSVGCSSPPAGTPCCSPPSPGWPWRSPAGPRWPSRRCRRCPGPGKPSSTWPAGSAPRTSCGPRSRWPARPPRWPSVWGSSRSSAVSPG